MESQTMSNICENNKKKYFEKGTVMIQMADNFFWKGNFRNWKICKEVNKEFVEVVMLVKWITCMLEDLYRCEKARDSKRKIFKFIIKIIQQKHILEYIKKSIGVDKNDNLYMRRVQFNQIDKDCFVGYYLDIDSNPDYLIACFATWI